MLLAIDGEEYLIKMPLVTGSCSPTVQLIGILLTELLTPLADCLIRHDDSALSQKLFHIAVTE